MPVYTVKQVGAPIEKPDRGYGPMQEIALVLNDGQSDVTAPWYTSAKSTVPQVGDTLEGEIEQGQYGPKFKKAKRPPPGGGPRVKSAEELEADAARQRMIVRQHSQTTAMRWAELQHARGKLPDEIAKASDLVSLIEFFYQDAMTAGASTPK